jgi:hypothetical protein
MAGSFVSNTGVARRVHHAIGPKESRYPRSAVGRRAVVGDSDDAQAGGSQYFKFAVNTAVHIPRRKYVSGFAGET